MLRGYFRKRTYPARYCPNTRILPRYSPIRIPLPPSSSFSAPLTPQPPPPPTSGAAPPPSPSKSGALQPTSATWHVLSGQPPPDLFPALPLSAAGPARPEAAPLKPARARAPHASRSRSGSRGGAPRPRALVAPAPPRPAGAARRRRRSFARPEPCLLISPFSSSTSPAPPLTPSLPQELCHGRARARVRLRPEDSSPPPFVAGNGPAAARSGLCRPRPCRIRPAAALEPARRRRHLRRHPASSLFRNEELVASPARARVCAWASSRPSPAPSSTPPASWPDLPTWASAPPLRSPARQPPPQAQSASLCFQSGLAHVPVTLRS
ncbi:leucine-rich repeat extensin-like protein 5 [Triticum aestivum]|uniref:leucine-rich repeat extensin-like protein 5 n=1 Tax=Triticum aestivum TaxID=4565 RepID=UPI001D02AAC6|nr:leucine-rich repeat extensin-like protein 5 [Triticum aestivum]